jgi:hypothetical protein
MRIQYGSIDAEVNWKFPSLQSFSNWRDDFFQIPNSNKFDVFLIGRFVDHFYGEFNNTSDVDIILTGNHNVEEIEFVINEATRLGIEKYNTFFDVLWFDKLPIYGDIKPNETETVNMYLPSNKWMEDGIVKKYYFGAIKVSENLWSYSTKFPNSKQAERIKAGYTYKKPIKINK